MTQSLTTQSPAPGIDAATMEKVLIQGDLKALTPRERVAYYNGVCQSLGLNPYTQPFAYLVLNNRLILYAKRECTDQLRKIHGVTLAIKAREVTEGCYVVTATATLPDGRQDESIGAVPIEGLKNESRANGLMKAETKAKRRVTLSICGLAFLDESELDSVREASPAFIDPQTGEALSAQAHAKSQGVAGDPPEPPATTEPEDELATASIRHRLEQFARIREAMGDADYYGILNKHGFAHANEVKQLSVARTIFREMQRALDGQTAQEAV
jgi:hypothetical protein